MRADDADEHMRDFVAGDQLVEEEVAPAQHGKRSVNGQSRGSRFWRDWSVMAIWKFGIIVVNLPPLFNWNIHHSHSSLDVFFPETLAEHG
jgi:hypothetical protein